MPEIEPVTGGVIEQHRAETAGTNEVAGEQRDRTRALSENAAERQRVIKLQTFRDVMVNHPACLLEAAAQPENASKEIVGRDLLVDLEARHTWLIAEFGVARQHPLHSGFRLGLVAAVVQRCREHTV